MTTRKPKAPVYYSKARLYVIRSSHIDKVYIGATTQQLSKRLSKHKENFKRWTNGKYCYVSSYEILQAGDAYIELLKECLCENSEQLCKYEGEAIRDAVNCCNKYITGRTKKEYREDNKEAIQQQKKEYNEAHKEAILQQKKEYYEQNRDKINEKHREHHKQYYEQNKQAIRQRQREYYEANKDKINQRQQAIYQQQKKNNLISLFFRLLLKPLTFSYWLAYQLLSTNL